MFDFPKAGDTKVALTSTFPLLCLARQAGPLYRINGDAESSYKEKGNSALLSSFGFLVNAQHQALDSCLFKHKNITLFRPKRQMLKAIVTYKYSATDFGGQKSISLYPFQFKLLQLLISKDHQRIHVEVTIVLSPPSQNIQRLKVMSSFAGPTCTW